MISIRTDVFETNSSSCHSLTFSTKGSAPKPRPHCWTSLDFEGGSWQWEWRVYHDSQAKLSYWLNAFVDNQSDELSRKNREARGVNDFYITERVQDEHHGPCLKEVYEEVLEETVNKLREVFKKMEEYQVQLYFGEISSSEEYLRNFEMKNSPETKENLFRQEFDYLVDLSMGIDHQSSPRESGECKELAEFGPEEVVEWVLGNGYFETNNDNDY